MEDDAIRDPAAGLADRLREGPPVVLDGALGTELERHGADASLPLWSARALVTEPELVARIHADHVGAGAELVTANTFRTQRRSLAHGGLGERAAELTGLAVSLARDAAAVRPGVFVAGSAPPLEDCYRPDRVPDDATLAREHAEHARHLGAAGVDAILVETHNCVREAVAATRAAHEAGADALVSFVCDDRARLLSGEPLAAALEAVAALAPLAVGVNCLPANAVAPCLEVMASAGLPFFVYANLGAPTEDGGFARSDELAPEAFADEAEGWVAAGARAVGGCCGTTPAHVAAIARRFAPRGGSRTQIVSPPA